MPSGLQKYDYDVIAQCNQMIKQKVGELEQHVSDLQREASQLVEQTWGGQAASSYNQSASTIGTEMTQRAGALDGLGQNVAKGATQMEDTDSAGGRTLQQVI